MDASFREVPTGRWLVGGKRRLGVVAALGFAISGLIGGMTPVDAGEGRFAEEATPELVVVSEDPYTNPGTYHRTQVEPETAAFGSTIVSVFQSGRSTNWGASNVGWSVSTDAGHTWTDGFLPGTTIHATPPGRWQRATDSAIAYDAKHDTWLIIGLGTRPCSFSLECAGSQVFVSRSTDGAQAFDAPILPKRARRSQFHDVPWVACDNFADSPFYGNCYGVWLDDAHRQLLNAYNSSDGGVTWTKATITPKQHCDDHPVPVVQPDGTVLVPLLRCRTADVMTVTSTDGGTSYAGARSDFQHFNERAPGGSLRAGAPMGSFAVDASGTIYAAWSDCWFRFQLEGECTHNDISFSTSEDGRHWTDKVRIPIDPVRSSADHFLPAIAVDPETSGVSAHIAIVYYFQPKQWCDPHTCQDHVGLASSLDGGSTWDFQQLAGPFKNTWFPLTDSGYMVGEYTGISFVDGKAVPVFPIAAKGRCKLGDLTSCHVWTASATIPI
jgi:hypothetical protein